MKRRDFLTHISFGVTSLVFSSTMLRGAVFPSSLLTRKSLEEWDSLRLSLPQDINSIIEVASIDGHAAFLKGGSVSSLINGYSDVKCVEIISDPEDFSNLKKRLTKLGVVGIPQPNGPINTIQFSYNNRNYVCEAISLDSFLQRNAQHVLSSRLLFKHSTILFQPKSMSVWDPFKICSERSPITCDITKKLEREPVFVKCVTTLQAELEQFHFQLKPSESLIQLESVWNGTDFGDQSAEKLLFTIVDYSCEVADLISPVISQKRLTSRLFDAAAQKALGISSNRILRTLGALKDSNFGSSYSESTLLMAALVATVDLATGSGSLIDLYRKASYVTAKQRTLMLGAQLAAMPEVQSLATLA